MHFYISTDIYIEKNCVSSHKNEFGLAGKKAVIVTGRHSSKINGALKDVEEALCSENIPYIIFDEVEENPSIENVFKAAEKARNSECDFVIGVGGGSPLDCAKAVSLLLANPDEDESCLYNLKALGYFPVIAVPTTCGTGSEVTPFSVLTNHEIKTKKSIPHKVFPKVALIDGKYLSKAKKEVIINTAIDALAHLIESYLNIKSDKINRSYSEYGLKLWAQNKDALLHLQKENKNPDDKTFENLMTASTFAGFAITCTGTALPHGMSYDLTYNYGLAHGKACGLFLASYMNFCKKEFSDDVNTILSLLNCKNLDEFSEMIVILNGNFKIPRKEKDILVKRMFENKRKLSASPSQISYEELNQMYEKSLLIED